MFCLNMTKLIEVFQSTLSLHFNEFVTNLCYLAGGSSQSLLVLKSYSTTFLVKCSHIRMEDLSSKSSYIFPPLVFANFSCELSKIHFFSGVHQAPLHYHFYKLISLPAWQFSFVNDLLLYYRRTISERTIGNLTSRPYAVIIWDSFCEFCLTI